MDYSEVAIRELQEAILKAERANVPADRCDELYRKAVHTRRIRKKMSLRRDERLRIIEMADDAINRNYGTPEILTVREDQKHLYIVETLSDALRLPGIRGSVETLTVSVSSIEALRDALSHVENIECATRVSQDTIEAAKYILKVREIVMMEEPEEPHVWCSSLYLFSLMVSTLSHSNHKNITHHMTHLFSTNTNHEHNRYTMSGKWGLLHEYVHSNKRKYCGKDMDSLSDDDMALIADHCLNRLTQACLVKALMEGRARGDPGHL